jgi:hypothetical protein
MSQDPAEEAGAPPSPAPPPIDPDPELIAHLEGNTRSLRGYRREAEKLRDEARSTGEGTPKHG